jgi:predicted amidohydrolase YtcJ
LAPWIVSAAWVPPSPSTWPGAPAGGRHHLAHLQVVHPEDVPRFAALGATANIQPLWATHEPQMDELTIPFLGERRAGWQVAYESPEER